MSVLAIKRLKSHLSRDGLLVGVEPLLWHSQRALNEKRLFLTSRRPTLDHVCVWLFTQ
jgi:hypothetical protein